MILIKGEKNNMLTLSTISVIDKIAIFFLIIFILAIGIALWRILTDET